MAQRNALFMSFVILLIAAPAGGSLLYFLLTDDPTVRPLGITKEAEEAFEGERKGVSITASVQWSIGREKSFSQAELTTLLKNAFQARGLELSVEYQTVKGAGPVMITYAVGSSQFGPTPLQRASDGVRAAAAAFHMLGG